MSLELPSSGTVDRKDGSTRFTAIVLRLRLTLPKGADPERAKRMLDTQSPTVAPAASKVRQQKPGRGSPGFFFCQHLGED